MSDIPSHKESTAPFGCKYEDKYILFCNGILKALIQSAAIGLIFCIVFPILYNFYWYPSDSDLPFSFRIVVLVVALWSGFLFSYLAYKYVFVWEKCVLDEEGFHYQRYNWFQSKTPDLKEDCDKFKEIPLCDILRFRLQHDELGYYVEIVTTEKPFYFCRSSRETRNQNWIVAAGNIVLSNLTGSVTPLSEESSENSSEMESSNSCVISTPFGCSFRDYYFSYKNKGLLRNWKSLLIVSLVVFLLVWLFPMRTGIQLLLLISLVLYGLVCYVDRKEEDCFLDSKGFHYRETVLAGYAIYFSNFVIPLNDILKFRLQNDENETFVEIVTKSNPFYICHGSLSKDGNRTQRWLVAAGNAVLSNFFCVDRSDLKIDETSCDCTLIRLYRKDIISSMDTVESACVKVHEESDRVEIDVREKKSPGFIILILVVLLLLTVYGCYEMIDYCFSDRLGFNPLVFIIIALLYFGLTYVFKNTPNVCSKHWTFTSDAAIKKQRLREIEISSSTFDLTHFSYMEIRRDVPFRLVLFDDNDRVICELDNLTIDEATLIANAIQHVL